MWVNFAELLVYVQYVMYLRVNTISQKVRYPWINFILGNWYLSIHAMDCKNSTNMLFEDNFWKPSQYLTVHLQVNCSDELLNLEVG